MYFELVSNIVLTLKSKDLKPVPTYILYCFLSIILDNFPSNTYVLSRSFEFQHTSTNKVVATDNHLGQAIFCHN